MAKWKVTYVSLEQATADPDAEVLFVPRVYVRHDCGDYI